MAISPERLAQIRSNVKAAAAQVDAAQQPPPEPPKTDALQCPEGMQPDIFANLPEDVKRRVVENAKAKEQTAPINPPEIADGIERSGEASAAVAAGKDPEVADAPQATTKTRKPRKPAAPAVDLAPVIEAIKAGHVELTPVLDELKAVRVGIDQQTQYLEALLELVDAFVTSRSG